jgi:hypothetical protein
METQLREEDKPDMRGPQSSYLTRAHYGAETLTRRARHAPTARADTSWSHRHVGHAARGRTRWAGEEKKERKKEGDGPRVEESWAVIGGNRPKAARWAFLFPFFVLFSILFPVFYFNSNPGLNFKIFKLDAQTNSNMMQVYLY